MQRGQTVYFIKKHIRQGVERYVLHSGKWQTENKTSSILKLDDESYILISHDACFNSFEEARDLVKKFNNHEIIVEKA